MFRVMVRCDNALHVVSPADTSTIKIKPGKEFPVGAIVGTVVGVIVVITIAIAAVVYFRYV